MMAKKTAAKSGKPAKAGAKAPVKKAPLASKQAAPAKKKALKKPTAEKPEAKPVVVAKGKVTAKAAPKKKVAVAKVAAKPAVAKKAAPRRRLPAKKAAAPPMGAAAGMRVGAADGLKSAVASVGGPPSPVSLAVGTKTGMVGSIDATKGTIASGGVTLQFKSTDVAPGVVFNRIRVGDEVDYRVQGATATNVRPVYTGRVTEISDVTGTTDLSRFGIIQPDDPTIGTIVRFDKVEVKPPTVFGTALIGKNVKFRLKPPTMKRACDVERIPEE